MHIHLGHFIMRIPTKHKRNLHNPCCVFSPWANTTNLIPFILNSMTYLPFFLVPETLKKPSSAYTHTLDCVWSWITVDTSRSFSTEPVWWSTNSAIMELIRMVSCAMRFFSNAMGKTREAFQQYSGDMNISKGQTIYVKSNNILFFSRSE